MGGGDAHKRTTSMISLDVDDEVSVRESESSTGGFAAVGEAGCTGLIITRSDRASHSFMHATRTRTTGGL